MDPSNALERAAEEPFQEIRASNPVRFPQASLKCGKKNQKLVLSITHDNPKIGQYLVSREIVGSVLLPGRIVGGARIRRELCP